MTEQPQSTRPGLDAQIAAVEEEAEVSEAYDYPHAAALRAAARTLRSFALIQEQRLLEMPAYLAELLDEHAKEDGS